MQYVVQFPAGTLALMEAALTVELGAIRKVFGDDSCLIFESEALPSRVSRLSCVRSAFVVLATTQRPRDPATAFSALAKAAAEAVVLSADFHNRKIASTSRYPAGLPYRLG